MNDLAGKLFKEAGMTGHDDMLNNELPFRRRGKTEEVGDLICFLLGPGSTYISGTTQVIDGAMTA